MKSKRQPPWTWSPEEIPDKGSSIAAGKNLNPDSWPNGKSVAVAFTFDVDPGERSGFVEEWNES